MGAGISTFSPSQSSEGCSSSRLKTGLDDIPESCIASVLVHLSPTQICSLARLSRSFRGAASADFVWELKLPKNYRYLVQKLFDEIPADLSKKEIYARLCRPNLFDGGAKVAWLEKITGGICMSISAKSLSITGIDDRRYWNYVQTEESRMLKMELRRWNKEVFSKREDETESIKVTIQAIVVEAEKGHMSMDSLSKRIQLIQSLLARALDTEIAWKQRSRAKWLKEWDKNSKFFHSVGSMHSRYNRISIIHVNGHCIEDKDEIAKEAILYFSSLLSEDKWNRPGLDSLQFDSLNSLEADSLVAPFSEEELKIAVSSLGSDKAPGPDGFPPCFFIFLWDLIKVDIMLFFKEFHDRGILSKGLGSSFIALIPKV